MPIINIHSEMLEGLTAPEISIFLHILKRVSKSREAFPSRQLLEKETQLSREALAKGIKGLTQKGIIRIRQENEAGKFGKTVYEILTDKAGIYLVAKGATFEEEATVRTTENRTTENRTTETRDTEKQHLSITSELSITSTKGIRTPRNQNKRNTIEESQEFYQNQIKGNSDKQQIKHYEKFVSLLFGENALNEPMVNILGIPKQLTFEQYLKLAELAKETGIKFSKQLYAMENRPKYTKENISLYSTLLNWYNKDKKTA